MIKHIGFGSVQPPLRYFADDEASIISQVQKWTVEIKDLQAGTSCQSIINGMSGLQNEIALVKDRNVYRQLFKAVEALDTAVKAKENENPDLQSLVTLIINIKLFIISLQIEFPNPQSDEETEILRGISSVLHDVLSKVDRFSLDPLEEINQRITTLRAFIDSFRAQPSGDLQELISDILNTEETIRKNQQAVRDSKEGNFAATFLDYLEGSRLIETLMICQNELNWGEGADACVIKYENIYLSAAYLDKIRDFIERIGMGDSKLDIIANPIRAKKLQDVYDEFVKTSR